VTRARPDLRKRGEIEERNGSLRVKVYAGLDPVTGKRIYLRQKIAGTDKAAYRQAEKTLNDLLSQVNKQRSTPSAARLSYALDEWMRVSDHEDSTADGYRGYIERTIKPVLGELPVNKITARTLESFYAELRRCRSDGSPSIEHKQTDQHDCTEARCKPHECKPLSASTVRQIHAILSGTLGAGDFPTE
jgi:integrase